MLELTKSPKLAGSPGAGLRVSVAAVFSVSCSSAARDCLSVEEKDQALQKQHVLVTQCFPSKHRKGSCERKEQAQGQASAVRKSLSGGYHGFNDVSFLQDAKL